MKYRVSVNIPNKESRLVNKIIDVVSQAGGGIVGNYSKVAMVLWGIETWKTESGACPYIGEVGKVTSVRSARIEMQCSEEKLREVIEAIKKVHPYEQPVIEVVKLEDISF